MASHDLELIFLQFWEASPHLSRRRPAPRMTRGYRAGAPRTIGWRRLHTALPALIAGCCTLAAAAASLASEAHALAVSLACAGERPAVHRAADHLGAAPLAPAVKLGVPDEPCRHTACDTPDRLRRGAFARVLRVVWPLLREVS